MLYKGQYLFNMKYKTTLFFSLNQACKQYTGIFNDAINHDTISDQYGHMRYGNTNTPQYYYVICAHT